MRLFCIQVVCVLLQYALHGMHQSVEGAAYVLNDVLHSQFKWLPNAATHLHGSSKYTNSLNLPSTSFKLNTNITQSESDIQTYWRTNDLYRHIFNTSRGHLFIIHDGPPYANGGLHMGHILNKCIKDFLNRFYILKKRRCLFIPGWDCHGLPIEMKIVSNNISYTNDEMMREAKKFAESQILSQKSEFQRIGIWGMWEQPYQTMNRRYEFNELKLFCQLFNKGYVYRGTLPVHWSPSTQTALSASEIEYNSNHKTKSIYISLQTVHTPSYITTLFNEDVILNTHLTIWTTSPWTLPANRAVLVHPSLTYSVIAVIKRSNAVRKTIQCYVVVKEKVMEMLHILKEMNASSDLYIKGDVKGYQLANTTYFHPFDSSLKCPLLLDTHQLIERELGTGMVHVAPCHGPEDHLVAKQHKVEGICIADERGVFVGEMGERLEGLDVLTEGSDEVIKMLAERGQLLKTVEIVHSYPYDTRMQKPTIFRSTPQWFIDVDKLRPQLLEALHSVRWFPSSSLSRQRHYILQHPDWCISRQRRWGLPLPILYNKHTGLPLTDAASISRLVELVGRGGSTDWWGAEADDLFRGMNGTTGAADISTYLKGNDTFDVWFDAGCSWHVLQENMYLNTTQQADYYIEGVDQLRGWFQSSLITSVATRGVAPYKNVVVHGFVLDEKGMKMSKSRGNAVHPSDILSGRLRGHTGDAYGADVLRLWAFSVNWEEDVLIGNSSVRTASDVYKKIRNTFRYLLANLYDFHPLQEAVLYEELPDVDKWMLGCLTEIKQIFEQSFEGLQFHKASKEMQRFLIKQLSAFYFDSAKDRLYISSPNSYRRRSCQTVLYTTLLTLSVLLAPVVPHLTESVWQHIPKQLVDGHHAIPSVFHEEWPSISYASHKDELMSYLMEIRTALNRLLEDARKLNELKRLNDLALYIHVKDTRMEEQLRQFVYDSSSSSSVTSRGMRTAVNEVDDLRFLLQVSQVFIVNSQEDIQMYCKDHHFLNVPTLNASVGITKATGRKCERCWMVCQSVGSIKQINDVCNRCAKLLRND